DGDARRAAKRFLRRLDQHFIDLLSVTSAAGERAARTFERALIIVDRSLDLLRRRQHERLDAALLHHPQVRSPWREPERQDDDVRVARQPLRLERFARASERARAIR